jgi:hypothetical protein
MNAIRGVPSLGSSVIRRLGRTGGEGLEVLWTLFIAYPVVAHSAVDDQHAIRVSRR